MPQSSEFPRSREREGFEVGEQQGGQSNPAFSYRVVAKRKDIEPERLAQIEMPEEFPEPLDEEALPQASEPGSSTIMKGREEEPPEAM